jgi:hypothetical protein
MNVLLNVAVFKIAWLSTVLGGANDMPLVGPIVVMGAIAIHLWLAAEPARELLLVLITGVIGVTWDSFMVSAGWLSYPSGVFISGVAPYWIVAMWMLFATTLNVSFRWMQQRLWLAAIMGAVFGPLSYYAGAGAGAVVLHNPNAAFTGLSIAWAIMLPSLLWLAQQLDGTQRPVLKSRI